MLHYKLLSFSSSFLINIIMMSKHPLRIFNMYDLQYGSDFPDHLHIQETIDYCETRFQVILSAFAHASDGQQCVIQCGLHK